MLVGIAATPHGDGVVVKEAYTLTRLEKAALKSGVANIEALIAARRYAAGLNSFGKTG
jgi:hypothetical protein